MYREMAKPNIQENTGRAVKEVNLNTTNATRVETKRRGFSASWKGMSSTSRRSRFLQRESCKVDETSGTVFLFRIYFPWI